MKIKYNREDETLLVWLADGLTVDHAEQQGDFIVHFSASDQPVLLEVLNASEFIVDVVRAVAERQSEMSHAS